MTYGSGVTVDGNSPRLLIGSRDGAQEMAHVYKRIVNGKPQSRWTVVYRDATGRKRSQIAYTDRSESERLALRLEDRERKIRDGLISRDESNRQIEGARDLSEHIEDYREHLEGKGSDPRYISHSIGILKRVLDFPTLNSVSEKHVSERFLEYRKSLSARTINYYRSTVRSFFLWLETKGRIDRAPVWIRSLPVQNEKTDRRRVRRAFTPKEFERLINVVTGLGDYKEMTGRDRSILYLLAANTGFRVGELRSLTRDSFDLENATVTVLAAYSKRRRDDHQPIPTRIIPTLRSWIDSIPTERREVFRLPYRTRPMLLADLEAAGIDPVDSKGRILDMHSFRFTYISDLVRKRVSPKVVQSLARHSTIQLTFDVYAQVDDDDLRRALE